MMTAMISVASAILTAAGRPGLAMLAALPVAPLALVGHLLVIPRFGAQGATVVTLVVAAVGAGLALAAVYRAWLVRVPWATVARVTAATTLTTMVGAWWHTAGALTIVELAVMIARSALPAARTPGLRCRRGLRQVLWRRRRWRGYVRRQLVRPPFLLAGEVRYGSRSLLFHRPSVVGRTVGIMLQ